MIILKILSFIIGIFLIFSGIVILDKFKRTIEPLKDFYGIAFIVIGLIAIILGL